jgi:hypothetical protein
MTRSPRRLVEVQPMCYVTLSLDHRVLDGYQANAFPARWVEEIEGLKPGAGKRGIDVPSWLRSALTKERSGDGDTIVAHERAILAAAILCVPLVPSTRSA